MATVSCLLRLAFCLIILKKSVVALSRPTAIVLENNEFKNILVAIDENVADNPSLIQKIKDAFTKASAFLYEATNHRAVFHDVTILVPAGWSNNNAYQPATSEIFDNADIIFTSPINPAPPPSGRKRRASDLDLEQASSLSHQFASTKAYAGCGHPGVRITLTTDILTKPSLAAQLGPPEKILVHEWAHFRWGVFDEYSLEGEPQFYFSPTTGQLEAVRCTELIRGIVSHASVLPGQVAYCRDKDNTTGLYPEDCIFKPYPAGPYTLHVEASIMDHVSIRLITKFCNDDLDNNSTKHNYDAPSRHNRLCSHRSTWDVISSTEDFSHSNNPRDGMDTAPVFKVVQASAARPLVLALDTSQSMADDEKQTRVSQAAAIFIQESVAPGAGIGLTAFSDKVHVQRAPVVMNTSQDRQAFADDLPDIKGGVTNITLALTTAAQLLRDSDQGQTTPDQGRTTQMTLSKLLTTSSSTPSPEQTDPVHHPRLSRRDTSRHVQVSHKARGGHVVVVTDGRATIGVDTVGTISFLRKMGVVVSFVVLGGPPHPQVEQLAHGTGGRVYCDNNFHTSTATTDAFFSLLEKSETPDHLPAQIHSRAKRLLEEESLDGDVFIEEELGKKTAFIVTYNVTVPNVRVRSPSGRMYSDTNPEYSLNHRLKMAKILIPGKAESGKWSYKITNSENHQRASLLVLSSPVNRTVQPLRVSGSLMLKKGAYPTKMHIFAEATRGENPVTGLRVIAHVETPTGDSEEVELMDNGAGADIIPNDGVYSRFYSKMKKMGLYTVRLSVIGHSHQRAKLRSLIKHRNVHVERSVYAGYIVVQHDHNHTKQHATSTRSHDDDEESPVRISDLRVVQASSQNHTVLLSWTASGDDTDHGKASHYEVYMAPSALDLIKGTLSVTSLTQSDVVSGSLVTTKPFGSREFYMIKLPSSTISNKGSVFFTVVAVDDAGNKGEHSNYVTVGM